MSSLEYFSIDIKPWIYAANHGGEEKLYRFLVKFNGEEYQMERVGDIPPYMTELEWLVRQAYSINDALREQEENKS